LWFLRKLLFLAVPLVLIWLILLTLRQISWGKLVLDWGLLLGYTQALAWPLVIFGAFLIFKHEITALLGRIKRAMWGDKGFEFEPTAGQQKPPELPPELQQADPNSDATAKPASPTPQEVMARPDIQLLFERIYRIMFGTQFDAMKRLQAYPDGLRADDLADIYEKHKTIAPNPRASLIDLMSFVVKTDLVHYDAQERVYKLLPAGELFLQYFKDQNWFDIPKPF
jgi:hypothetical protein